MTTKTEPVRLGPARCVGCNSTVWYSDRAWRVRVLTHEGYQHHPHRCTALDLPPQMGTAALMVTHGRR